MSAIKLSKPKLTSLGSSWNPEWIQSPKSLVRSSRNVVAIIIFPCHSDSIWEVTVVLINIKIWKKNKLVCSHQLSVVSCFIYPTPTPLFCSGLCMIQWHQADCPAGWELSPLQRTLLLGASNSSSSRHNDQASLLRSVPLFFQHSKPLLPLW